MHKQTLKLNAFNIQSPNQQNYSYNFYANNTLSSAFGIQQAKFTYGNYTRSLNTPSKVSKILGLYYFGQMDDVNKRVVDRILMYGTDGKLYTHQMFSGSFSFSNLHALTFESCPTGLLYRHNDKDVMLLSTPTKKLVWKAGVTPYVADLPDIGSICVNNGIIYSTLKFPPHKIWYNKNLNLEAIGEENSVSGYISLDDDLGFAKQVISMGADVFVFREYGISKIVNYKNEFVVSEVYKSNTKIYCNTACVCGNQVLFMTKDGVLSFNGTSVKNTNLNFANLAQKSEDIVVSSLGKFYYMAGKFNFDDGNQILCEQDEEHINNALIIVDAENFTYQIMRGVDILNFLPLKTNLAEKMLVIYNSGQVRTIGEIGLNDIFYDETLPKFWCQQNLFKNSSPRLITKLKVNCTAGVEFDLILNGATKHFKASKDGINIFCLKQKSNNAGLKIACNKQSAKIDSVEIEYYDC